MNFLRRYGQTEKLPIVRERDGRTGGIILRHWDGRQDAVVTPDPVKEYVYLSDYGLSPGERTDFMYAMGCHPKQAVMSPPPGFRAHHVTTHQPAPSGLIVPRSNT